MLDATQEGNSLSGSMVENNVKCYWDDNHMVGEKFEGVLYVLFLRDHSKKIFFLSHSHSHFNIHNLAPYSTTTKVQRKIYS